MNTAELKKLIERITQGKWILSENINDTQDKPFREFCVEGENGEEIIGFFTNAANAEAIALVPKLLRENEQLREALKHLLDFTAIEEGDVLNGDGADIYKMCKAALAGDGVVL